MPLDYDPATSLRQYPTPMGKYGKTPHGENLYRVVLRDSVRQLVGGAWKSECGDCKGCGFVSGGRCPECHGSGATAAETGYHWRPRYPNVAAAWILERWQMPKITRTAWERDLVDPESGWPLLGPYPHRGEYELVWEFDHGVESDSLDKIVGFVEWKLAGGRTYQDDRGRLIDEYSTEQREFGQNAYLDIREGMTAFGSAPISAGRFGRGTKTMPEVLTARQAGMPTPRGLPSGHGRKVGPLEISNSLSAGVRI